MSGEDSGGSCDYYVKHIECPIHRDPYTAECGDIIQALGMTVVEGNVFKELWRRAAARQGKKKRGNSTLRGAEKIKFFSDRLYQLELHEAKK